MFVTTTKTLDDYPNATPSRMDSNSFSAAMVEAAKRAINLAPGDVRYVEFVTPPKYANGETKTVVIDDCKNLYREREWSDIAHDLKLRAMDELAKELKPDEQIVDNSLHITPIGEADVVMPALTWVYTLVVNDQSHGFDDYDEACEYAKNNTVGLQPKINVQLSIDSAPARSFFNTRLPIQMIHDSYEISVVVRQPIDDETRTNYIVYGG